MQIRLLLIIISCTLFTILPGCGSNPAESVPVVYNFKLSDLYFETAEPSYLNVLFQVTDMNDRGISYLDTADFRVDEDGKPISPTESRLAIRKMDELPYTIKTILLLDISPSMANDISTITNAAGSLINNIVDQQEVAIYTFSSEVTLIQDFTNSKTALLDALTTIEVPLGSFATDLFGAISETVQMWTDSYSLAEPLSQGFLIVITDSADDAGNQTLEETLGTRGERWVYTIGLGTEIDTNVLSQIGNRGFHNVSDINRLQSVFDAIQGDIVLYSNSFYWLSYLSSLRNFGDHKLTIAIRDNKNIDADSRIEHVFNSGVFFNLSAGVRVNSTECNREGLFDLQMLPASHIALHAVSHYGLDSPNFDWRIDAVNVASIQVIAPGDSIILTATGLPGQSIVLTATDTANLDMHPDYSRKIAVNIVDNYSLDFEADDLPTFVRVCGNWALDSTYFADGLSSLSSSAGSDEPSSNAVRMSLPVPNNTNIRIEFDVLEAIDDGRGYIMINGDSWRIDTDPGRWLHKTFNIATGADIETLELSFIHDPGPSGILCLDNIHISIVP